MSATAVFSSPVFSNSRTRKSGQTERGTVDFTTNGCGNCAELSTMFAVAPPVEMKARPVEEQAVFRERLDSAMERAKAALAKNEIDSGAIGELLKLARQISRQSMWVYWRLSEKRLTVNVPLLAEIARQEGYARGWIFFKREEIHKRLAAKEG